MSLARSTTRRVIVLRHASAGRRDPRSVHDDERHLDDRGRATSESLVASLSGYQVARILSSPAERCTATVGPLAEHLQLPIETRPQLAIGHAPGSARALLDDCDDLTLICTHREVIAEIVGADRVPARGGALVMHYESGGRFRAERLAAQQPELALEPA